MNRTIWLNRLVQVSLALTLIVVLLGAYTRLKDAGLGCPDWPGCYGQLLAPSNEANISKAQTAFPGQIVEVAKAQTEMLHRYFAGSLGLLILGIGVLAYSLRRSISFSLALPFALIALVTFQALLGMYTVTMRLNPTIVLLHLLGGFSTLSLLWICWLNLRKKPTPMLFFNPGLNALCLISLFVLIAQIILGGWVSTNYAALTCPDFPLCQGKWLPSETFAHAFPFFDLNRLPDKLSMEARMTIQIYHRIGALITTLFLGALAFCLFNQSKTTYDPRAKRWLQRLSIAIIGLLAVQICLGITNVLALLPISIAVLHNGIAVLLLLTLITLNYTLFRARR